VNDFLASFRVYRDRRMLAILFMGFASGLPLALTGSTLAIWLKESGISLTAIGLFALVGVSYNAKFLWAPLVDRVKLPILTRMLGRRRSWAVAIQGALIVALLLLGNADPAVVWPIRVATLAVLVAFLSASQDIVIDAYRVELLHEDEQGAGAAATQVGYRVGMIASGAGALYVAAFVSWFWAYAAMAALMLVGVITVLMTREPAVIVQRAPTTLKSAIVEPFTELGTRDAWLVILIFVVLFKFGDALAGVMSSPFYVALGFSKVEIANIAKLFGLVASVAGLWLGGLMVFRLGVMRALMVCGILQMLANLMYIVQLWAGPDVEILKLTIAIENVTGGMSSAAFVAYLSRLCSPAYTATQYALLSALAAVARTLLASSGGGMVDTFGWTAFFLIATGACIPSLAILAWLMRRGAAPVAA
jgi:MFS transporter, PAT family, beta-lactamase induction signal transducer AmpG